MHKFPHGIQTILDTVSHCAKHNDVKVFLHGDLVLYAITGNSELIQQQNIQIILSYESEINTNKLYQCLIDHIVINREVENSPLKYHFVSDGYEIQIDLIAQFDPTLLSHVQRFGSFSVDLAFLDLASQKIKHLPDLDPNILHNINHPTSWVFEDILGFVERKGRFPDLEIPTDEYDHLRTISLGTLKESIDIGWNQQIQNILLLRHSGSALKFMSGVFVDGMVWSFKALVDYMIFLNVGINEESNIETVFNDKKFELIDLYNEFFLDGKIVKETPEEVRHRLNTVLKLLFDSPNLDIPRPYINTSSIQAMAECGDGDSGIGSGTGHCDVFAELPGEAANKVACNSQVSPFCCSNLATALQEQNPNTLFIFSTFWSAGANCPSSDPEITTDLPSDFCPYGECFACTPSLCEPLHCCCCTSIDLVRDIRARCYDRVYFSCNQDGTSPGPGEDVFPAGCPQCFEACDFALEENNNTCEDISGHGDSGKPDWWGFGNQTIGPCSCDCAELVNPADPTSDCNLTCVTCQGLKCNSQVDVTAGNCSYQFDLSPGLGCCGTPAVVDVIFVIDYSQSMNVVIDDVKQSAEDFSAELATVGGLARFGLVVFGQNENDGDPFEIIFTNGEILTTDVAEFRQGLEQFIAIGAVEPAFDSVEFALFTYPWSGVENVLFLIGNESVTTQGTFPISGGLGDPAGQPSAELLIGLANSLGVTVHTVQTFNPDGRGADTRKTDLAQGTNGMDLDILVDFSLILEDLNLNVFGASCECMDTTPVPAVFCPGGDCSGRITDIPIRKCVEENNSDCTCNEPLTFDICGEIVVVQPDEDTLNLVCCSDIEGGGCDCPTDLIPPEGCCGLACSGIDICPPAGGFQKLQDAIDAIWCECWNKAVSGTTEESFFLVDPLCSDCVVPEPGSEHFANFDAIVACEIKIPDGQGGFFRKTRAEVVAEVTAAWAACEKPDEEDKPPPSISAECDPECDRADECLVGDLSIGDNDDIKDSRSLICANASAGSTSVRNPATVILNNGIGLVAYESMVDTSVINIDQFNTSIPAKILPNRRTDYGRLQHELKWQITSDDPSISTSIKLAKLYYFEDIASHFINGTDILVFQSGPFQNQCFTLDSRTSGSIGTDDTGDFIGFEVPIDYALSNPFPSLDDVYDIEWFIVDSDDQGLTGSVGDTAAETTPGFDFLLGSPVSAQPGANKVNTLLQLTPHIHDGVAVPVANPSLAVAHNYMNATENSHFVYLAYQALEDSKWNIYLRQLRLSEYSKEKQIDSAITAESSLSDPSVSFDTLLALGVSELIYRVICTNDECVLFGDDFIAKRSVTLEITLIDGREVFNKFLLGSAESWSICPGLPSRTVAKERVFAELSHSAIVNKCPDQFEFNDIFYNWDVGDEFSVPFTELAANDLFVLLRKPNDSSIEISESDQVVSGITISSSQVGAVWYDDSINSWGALNTEFFQDLLKYKGLDSSAPVPLTDFENGHCTHPVVKVNSNNEVYVIYECTDPQTHQIHITGTVSPTSSFPTGIFQPKNIDANLDYFLSPDDFVYSANITSSTQGINQLPDIHIDVNDIIHIAWQSSRDNYWEIYYGKSDTSFSPKRITDFKSKSLKPSIHGDNRGNVHIAWHDDRFGNWEILMAYRDEERPLTLFEQDPYMAVVRNEGYKHFPDVLTFVMPNTTDEAICISNLSVRFFNDRLLTQSAFEVVQSDFPIAFQIPGAQDDRLSVDLVYADLVEWTSVSGTSSTGNPVNIFSPPEAIDTILIGSEFETITITFDTIQPQDIILEAGGSTDTTDASWTDGGTTTLDVTSSVSGEAIAITSDLKGRYKKISIALLAGDELTSISKITITSVEPNRFCIAPNSSLTGFLDLSPSIRIDQNGNEVIESPIPVEARKNIVYFTAVTGIQSDGSLISFPDQKRSVSCETCVASTDPWEFLSCTVLFEFENTTEDILFFNSRVRFYADRDKLDLVAQFDAFNDGQLEFFTINDNQPAQSVWQTAGYEIFAGNKRTVTLWPLLSNTTGLLCGVRYWVDVEICSGTPAEPCVRTDLVSIGLNSWICDCASSRWSEQFGSAPINVFDTIKWNSSGDGLSDTRLTETGFNVNNYNPQIRIRSDLTGIVLFETDRDAEKIHSIYASAFRVFPSSNMYASGAEAITSFGDVLIRSDIPIAPCSGTGCGDCNNSAPTCNAIEGRNVAFSLDQYDNIFLATEQQHDQRDPVLFETGKQQSILVHRCGAQAANLAFIPESEDGSEAGIAGCDAEEILGKAAPVIEDKTFRQIIKMARVSNKSAKYHITRSKKPAAVVDQCDVFIEIITQPDVISVRLRNENDDWSTWFPFDPEIGEYTIVVPWVLSSSSGAKAVTVEAATYQGLSGSFALTIIADYKGIDHTVEFFKLVDPDPTDATKTNRNAPSNPATGPISNDTLIELLNVKEPDAFPREVLPLLDGVPVAGLRKPTLPTGATEIQNLKSEFIYVEISVPQSYLDSIDSAVNTPTFDLLQQGDEDLFSLPTVFFAKGEGGDGKFRGVFPIKKDNESLFRDGLSFIIPHFFNDCSDLVAEATAEGSYVRDRLNVPVPKGTMISGSSLTTEDIWAAERSEIGEILSKIDIRGTDDPYFVFGNPNYRLKKQDE